MEQVKRIVNDNLSLKKRMDNFGEENVRLSNIIVSSAATSKNITILIFWKAIINNWTLSISLEVLIYSVLQLKLVEVTLLWTLLLPILIVGCIRGR